MFNEKEFWSKAAKVGCNSISSVSARSGIEKTTLSRRFKDNEKTDSAAGEDFTVGEIEKLGTALDFSYDDIMNIFFPNFVA